MTTCFIEFPATGSAKFARWSQKLYSYLWNNVSIITITTTIPLTARKVFVFSQLLAVGAALGRYSHIMLPYHERKERKKCFSTLPFATAGLLCHELRPLFGNHSFKWSQKETRVWLTSLLLVSLLRKKAGVRQNTMITKMFISYILYSLQVFNWGGREGTFDEVIMIIDKVIIMIISCLTLPS